MTFFITLIYYTINSELSAVTVTAPPHKVRWGTGDNVVIKMESVSKLAAGLLFIKDVVLGSTYAKETVLVKLVRLSKQSILRKVYANQKR